MYQDHSVKRKILPFTEWSPDTQQFGAVTHSLFFCGRNNCCQRGERRWFASWCKKKGIEPLLHTAAAAKPLQSCPTLCDPTDGSPPGSPIPGILQARTLESVRGREISPSPSQQEVDQQKLSNKPPISSTDSLSIHITT